MTTGEELLDQLHAAVEAHWDEWDSEVCVPGGSPVSVRDAWQARLRQLQDARQAAADAYFAAARPAAAGSGIDAVRVDLARAQGERAAGAIDAIFRDAGFDAGRHGDEIAHACRTTPLRAGLAGYAADVATAVLARHNHPHDPAAVRAAAARHLAGPHVTPPDGGVT